MPTAPPEGPDLILDAEGGGPLPPLLYDASRLSTRVLNATPNGIDRLDALLARAILGAGDAVSKTLAFGWGGPRLLPSREGLAALNRAERAWGEQDRRTAGVALEQIAAWLRGGEAIPTTRIVEPRRGRVAAGLEALRRLGLKRGADPAATASRQAVYLNATHFPMEWPSHVAWLDRRPDVRLTLLIHDLLPLDRPEFFWKKEAERHRARLALLARRGAGAFVTTRAVAERLRAEMARAGRQDFLVHHALPPVAPLFHARTARDSRLEGVTYFITCGTIEPRKNHGLLLRVWRRLAARLGRAAPKLVVVGKRGWLCEDIVREMHDPALAGLVLEVSGLTSGDYKVLLDHAQALLAPSFAEGFGLPVAEALTAGTPVIASDIDAFREQDERLMTLIDPCADDEWLEAIAAVPHNRPRVSGYSAISPKAYLSAVVGFLREVA